MNEMRRDEKCLDYAGGAGQLGVKDRIMVYTCHGQGGNQKWKMNENNLIEHESGFCIEMLEDRASIVMQRCDAKNPRQVWRWKSRNL